MAETEGTLEVREKDKRDQRREIEWERRERRQKGTGEERRRETRRGQHRPGFKFTRAHTQNRQPQEVAEKAGTSADNLVAQHF